MTEIISLIIFILLASAAVSMVEAALFSISLSKTMALAKGGARGAKTLLGIKEKIGKPIVTLVIINNTINIVGSIFVGVRAGALLGEAWIGWLSGVLTFLIIIFGEIIPKSIGASHAEKVALFAARPLFYLTKLFTPFIFLAERVVLPFTTRKQIISEEEIKIMSNLAHMGGSIESDEREMIEKVFRLNDLSARDVMTPRTSMFSLNMSSTIGEARQEIIDCPYSRIPIYEKNRDHVVGMCMETDLLTAVAKGENDKKIGDFKRKVIFVSQKAKLDYLLKLFQSKKSHLAVVKDEFDATVGVITLEDVLEQLVGEIIDEGDSTVDPRTHAENQARLAEISRDFPKV